MLLTILQQSPAFLIGLIFVLGLLVGSFLNVVIYRLPVMMQRGWRRDCLEYLELPAEEQTEAFNLLWPGSRCPVCKTEIKPYQNIPVFSYLWLRGKCAQCATPISPRYPLIEAFTAICSALVAWHFGYGLALLFGLVLTWSLIALSFIDIDHQLLPDSITLPMLWLGLFLSLFSIYTDSHASIVGAVAGYLSLWSVYHLFKLLTGKEGMGYGDFKLLAMLGAWMGWHYLPLIIILSSLVGAVIGIAMIVFRRCDAGQPIPFGPYLATAGWLALIWGDAINRLYLDSVGL
ncbi:prepilin peptidase [Methylomonas rapida]|uniref:Prepilin leader peptidase/N-methyltransferase n=1 Tax=Methylomonas rapida TaxID=2963939 RepID=A0ABY7GKB7_9GAMM|nr:A24 family peptidase [Methylomonas rapida]WAR44833.1 A24 family peptidase [Methylomonas rapida]